MTERSAERIEQAVPEKEANAGSESPEPPLGVRRANVVPLCPVCGFEMKWWFAKWKCFNCGQWNGCCGDSTGDPFGLWCEPRCDGDGKK